MQTQRLNGIGSICLGTVFKTLDTILRVCVDVWQAGYDWARRYVLWELFRKLLSILQGRNVAARQNGSHCRTNSEAFKDMWELTWSKTSVNMSSVKLLSTEVIEYTVVLGGIEKARSTENA